MKQGMKPVSSAATGCKQENRKVKKQAGARPRLPKLRPYYILPSHCLY